MSNNPVADPEKLAESFIAMIGRIPLRRAGSPLDIAKGVAFLASPEAGFITGANIVMDGGIINI